MEYFMENNSISFIGEYIDGKRNGYSQIYELLPNGTTRLQYDGILKNGMYQGIGTLYYDGLMYHGDFEKGKFNGRGNIFNDKGITIYSGTFRNGKFNGNGKLLSFDEFDYIISSYIGEFQNGIFSGKGTYQHFCQDTAVIKKYEGTFLKNQIVSGTLYINSSLIYQGEFRKNRYHGYGILSIPTNQIYVGYFKDGLRHGNGIIYNFDNLEIVCSGKFVKNCFQNRDIEYYKLDMNIEKLIDCSQKTIWFLNTTSRKTIEFYYKKKQYPFPNNKSKRQLIQKILQFRFIEKSLATNSNHLYHKITKESLVLYSKYHKIIYKSNNKLGIWNSLFQSRHIENEEDEAKYDFFGTEITIPVLANDSHIYDKTSLDKLFEQNMKVSLHNNIEINSYETLSEIQHIPEKVDLFHPYKNIMTNN